MKLLLIFICFITNIYAAQVFEDKTNTLTLHEVKDLQDKFIHRDKKSFTLTKSAIWIKQDFENTSSNLVNKYIVFESNLLEKITLFYKNKNNVTIKEENGLNIPIKNRGIKSKKFIFEIPIEAQNKKTIYIKIKTKHILDYAYTILPSKNDLFEKLLIINTINTFSFAILIFMFFIISIISLYTKEKIYISYLAFVLFTIVVQLFISGTIQYLHSFENPNMLLKLSVNVLFITIFFFLITIFELNRNYPKLKNYLLFLSLVFLILTILEPFNIETVATFRVSIVTPLSMLSIIFTIIFTQFKKLAYANFIFVGWFFFILSALLLNLNHLGLINTENYVSIWQLGTLVEAVAFSLMLLYRVKKINEQNYQQKEIIQKQSKLATIGETLSHIEHQWRSPLAKISSILMELQSYLRFKGSPTKEHLEKSINEANKILLYMTGLVNDFKNFYILDREKKFFSVKSSIDSTLKLLHHQLEKNKINVIIDLEKDLQILGYHNEFIQVLINITSNSKDILIERNIKNPTIHIIGKKEEDSIILIIKDNGQGIKESYLNIIFEQFYSNKMEKSSGIGLYISKNIVEQRMNGSIEVYNNKEGAVFKIVLGLKNS